MEPAGEAKKEAICLTVPGAVFTVNRGRSPVFLICIYLSAPEFAERWLETCRKWQKDKKDKQKL